MIESTIRKTNDKYVMMNDTNDSIYELFETIVNESFSPVAVNVTEEMLKHGNFVARINIRNIRPQSHDSRTVVVEFDPITIHWPEDQSTDRQSARPRSTELAEAPYSPSYKNASQFQAVKSKLSKNGSTMQKVRFVLTSTATGKFDRQIQRIDSFLPR